MKTNWNTSPHFFFFFFFFLDVFQLLDNKFLSNVAAFSELLKNDRGSDIKLGAADSWGLSTNLPCGLSWKHKAFKFNFCPCLPNFGGLFWLTAESSAGCDWNRVNALLPNMLFFPFPFFIPAFLALLHNNSSACVVFCDLLLRPAVEARTLSCLAQ